MRYKTLKNSIATLQKLRDAYYSQLDTSVLAELDDVLQQLNQLAESDMPEVPLGEVALRGIQIIDCSLRLVTNISDFLR